MALLGRKKIKFSYSETQFPEMGRMLIPNNSLMQRTADREMIAGIASTAHEYMLSALQDRDSLSPALNSLDQCLDAVLDSPEYHTIVLMASYLGYVIGQMENVADGVTEGLSEKHYLTALAIAFINLPDKVTRSVYSDFIRDAGYVLARSYDSALATLCEVARTDLRAFRTRNPSAF